MNEIKTVGVAGCGTMGAGIAIVAARAGFRTIVYDTREDALARARKQTEGFFAKSVERGKLKADQVSTILWNLVSTTKIHDMAACDVVIEAVFEDLKVKHAVVREVEEVLPENAIVASNTSTIPITLIGQASRRPERLLGMHFFFTGAPHAVARSDPDAQYATRRGRHRGGLGTEDREDSHRRERCSRLLREPHSCAVPQ